MFIINGFVRIRNRPAGQLMTMGTGFRPSTIH